MVYLLRNDDGATTGVNAPSLGELGADEVVDFDDVAAYLRTHADLLPHVREALAALRERFPGDPLVLDLFVDDNVPSWRYLDVFPRTRLAPEDALEHLTRTDEQVMAGWPAGIAERLSLSVRFR